MSTPTWGSIRLVPNSPDLVEVVIEEMLKHNHLEWVGVGVNQHRCACGWGGPISIGFANHKGWHAHQATAVLTAISAYNSGDAA